MQEIGNVPLCKWQRPDSAQLFLHGLITYSTAYTLMHHAPVMLKPDKQRLRSHMQTTLILFFFQFAPELSCTFFLFLFHMCANIQYSHICTRLKPFGLGAADICATIILAHWVSSQLHAGVELHCFIKNSNSGHTEWVPRKRWNMNDSGKCQSS